MTEQDDQFSRDKTAPDESADRLARADSDAAVQAGESLELSAQPAETEEESLKTAGEVAGGGIAAGEVRSVTPPPAQQSSNLPLVLLVLVVVLVVAGYFLISGGFGPETKPVVVSAVAKKQPMPKRELPTDPVAEQSVEQPSVASVEPSEPASQGDVTAQSAPLKVVSAAAPVAVESTPEVLYSVLVGPFITRSTQDSAMLQLKQLGFEPQLTQGKGVVTMTRLLEGVYPAAEARKRISEIKKTTGDAFLLPTGEKRSIYVGSFSDAERAASYAAQLAKKGLQVSLVTSDIEMSGRMLLAVQADQKTARQVAELIGRSGLKTQVLRK